MPFSPASRLSDQSRVWVERSIYDGVDAALEASFGPAQGRTDQRKRWPVSDSRQGVS